MCQCGFSFYRMNPGDEPQVLRLGVSKVIKKDKRTRGQATPIAHYSGETLRRRDLQSSKSESTTGLTESRTYRGGRKRGLIFFPFLVQLGVARETRFLVGKTNVRGWENVLLLLLGQGGQESGKTFYFCSGNQPSFSSCHCLVKMEELYKME